MDDLPPALLVSDLHKRYGPTVALDDLSLAVKRGEVHALLGENGAGKSTLVKLLSGLTEPDGGAIAVFGDKVNIGSPKAAHRLGIGLRSRKSRSSRISASPKISF